jgi:hypothetical protein
LKIDEYKKAVKAERRRGARIGFLIHVFFYVVVNTHLLLNEKLYYPLILWSLFGIIPHFMYAVALFNKMHDRWERAVEKHLTEK